METVLQSRTHGIDQRTVLLHHRCGVGNAHARRKAAQSHEQRQEKYVVVGNLIPDVHHGNCNNARRRTQQRCRMKMSVRTGKFTGMERFRQKSVQGRGEKCSGKRVDRQQDQQRRHAAPFRTENGKPAQQNNEFQDQGQQRDIPFRETVAQEPRRNDQKDRQNLHQNSEKQDPDTIFNGVGHAAAGNQKRDRFDGIFVERTEELS